MTWFEQETQDRPRSGLVRAFRKLSAGTRWIVLVVLVGLGTAALVGIGAALFWALVRSNL